jgi:hypothetical protein
MAIALYKNTRVFIATKHKKEQVIAPIFEKVYNARPFASSLIDTDQFGTFTREIERVDDPIETLRKKCKYGNEMSGCHVVIASEGSFGAHPAIPFTNANEEIVMLKDFKNNLEVIGKYLSSETNLYEKDIKSLQELNEVFEKIQFPSHGLIVKDIDENEVILKNEFDKDHIIKFVSACLKSGQNLLVSSDMRAVYNPTRMKNIEHATLDLIKNLKSCCPECDTPGFIIKENKSGLPCLSCGLPTRSILYSIKVCQKCSYEQENKFPNGKESENPMYCDFCNP